MKRVFANIGFSVAVALVVLNFMNVKAALAALVASGVAFIVSVAVPKIRSGKAISLCLLGVCFACALFASFYYGTYLPQTKLFGKTASVRAYIIDLPQKTSSGKYLYTVKTQSISGSDVPQNIKFEMYSESPVYAEAYDVLDMRVSFDSVADNAYDSMGRFDDNIFVRGYLSDCAKTGEVVKSANKPVVELRAKLKKRFNSVIKNDEGGLAFAVLTGDKSLLGNEAYTAFRLCGATHLMAVSGLHMSILFGVLYSLLKKLFVPKVPRVSVCAVGILFYIILSGFSKSMIRCGIMMLVFLLGKLVKKKNDSLNSLGFAAFIVCLNPYAVADAGAQLTFTAVLGLITVAPHIQKKIKIKNKVFSYFAGILCASLAVTATTLPSMYFLFGFVSFAGIASNLLLIPLATVLLVLSALFAILSSVPAFAWLFGNLCWLVSHAMLKFTDLFSRGTIAGITVGGQKLAAAICSIFLLFGTAFLIKAFAGKVQFKACSFIAVALAISITAVFGSFENSSVYVRVLSGDESCAVMVYNNKSAVVYGLREYDQYYKAQKIASVYNLNIECVLEGDAETAFAFANRNNCKVITSADVSKIKKYDVPYMKSADLTVDLQGTVVVKYNSGVFTASSNGTEIVLSDEALNNSAEYDCVYVINKNGCVQRSVNKWAD